MKLIRCINTGFNIGLTIDKVYEVVREEEEGNVEIKDNDGDILWYPSLLFKELADETIIPTHEDLKEGITDELKYVKCIGIDNIIAPTLTIDKLYKVTEAFMDMIKVSNDIGEECWYYFNLFVEATKEEVEESIKQVVKQSTAPTIRELTDKEREEEYNEESKPAKQILREDIITINVIVYDDASGRIELDTDISHIELLGVLTYTLDNIKTTLIHK